MTVQARFPSPYDLKAPPGSEGWRELYPYYSLFQDERKAGDEKRFWFCDAQHWPTPFRPFDTIMVDYACKCLGQYNTRHLMVPPANGVDYRIHNGYLYMNPIAVAPEKIPERVPIFLERAGFYFQNWNKLLENWHVKIRKVIDDLEAIKFETLPDMVPKEWILEGRGLDNTYDLLENYDRAISFATRRGSITSNSSISATPRISTSSASAKSNFPTSRTRPSRAWCRASMSTYFGRTTS